MPHQCTLCWSIKGLQHGHAKPCLILHDGRQSKAPNCILLLTQVPGPYCRNLDDVPQPAQDTKGAPKGAPPSAHAPKGGGGQKGARKG